MEKRLRVCVVGAGVNGVTTAYQIMSHHPYVNLTLIAEEFTPNTTSDAAAGYWRPPPHNNPEERAKILKWAEATKNYVISSVYNDPEAHLKGFSLCHGYHLAKKKIEVPYWSVMNLSLLGESEMQKFPLIFKSGYRYTAPVTEGRFYLPYFLKEVRKRGGKIISRRIGHINELYNDFDIIINCSGVGARRMANDPTIYPVRGYVLRVEAPWVKEFIYTLEKDENDKTIYIYPLQDSVVLGGYKQANNLNRECVNREREDILKDAAMLIPSLGKAKVISENVGFRPVRPNVRLELEPIGQNKAIIHNYGHGGSGWTLYWGCSLDVLKLFNKFVENKNLLNKSKL